MRQITDPMAIVTLRWLEGGPHPEAGTSMAATAVFVLGGDEGVVPDWPAGGEHFSVMLEFLDTAAEPGKVDAKVDFLARDQVADLLHDDATFLLMAGPKPIAEARVTTTFASGDP